MLLQNEKLFYICTRCQLFDSKTGEMAEWSNAAVLKTVDCYRSGGSNPSFSAKRNSQRRLWVFCFQKCRKFIFVNNLKQKTKHAKCIWVSILARYFLLGCTKWIPLSLQTSAKLKNKNHQVYLSGFFTF